ncbi:hypothetical protein GOV08_04900 [Candidatus Woesearchaeota archaeon]|nr:hypothetical protein [Candidatus Woesearchaeota archaeon]
MVLESLEDPVSAEKHPKHMFWFGLIYTSIAIIISLWVFREESSLVMIFLTVIAMSPLMYKTIKYEEQKDMIDYSERLLLKEHSRALSFFMYFFFGATISYALWYALLPIQTTQALFSSQISTILNINGGATGFSVQAFEIFSKIFFNNIRVLVFCLIFSFLYGVGAVFILTWNASVIGAAIGNFIRSNIAAVSSVVGAGSIFGYFKVISLGIIRYAIHGIPEILAYFVAGLAGGIISVAAIKHDFRTKNFEKIVLDSSDLIIISVVLVFFAALLEVFVTPIFF